jgi:hypothetical protein
VKKLMILAVMLALAAAAAIPALAQDQGQDAGNADGDYSPAMVTPKTITSPTTPTPPLQTVVPRPGLPPLRAPRHRVAAPKPGSPPPHRVGAPIVAAARTRTRSRYARPRQTTVATIAVP